jgi:hypothetical protein
MWHAGLARNFEWVLRSLTERGHQVHIGLERRWGNDDDEIIQRLTADYKHITCGPVPVRRDRWAGIASDLRQAASYLRYLEPEYLNAPKLRARAADKAPDFVVLLSRLPSLRSRSGRRLLARLLRSLEAAVPRAAEVDAYLEKEAFDLVMATPLVSDPTQVEWLRSASARGLPTVFPVASWDNLSLKALVFEKPGRTYVWNELQRREAAKYHGLPPETVAVVGAHSFDHWFTWKPSTSRAEFCARIGLDPESPFVLYVCSSKLIANDERPLVVRWVEGIRAHGQLKNVGVLVRPHPQAIEWVENPLAGVPNTAVWPPTGTNPFHRKRREDYYDSLYHSAAAVGINTTALIEAAIIGRRTFTFVAPEAQGGQEGTLHFHYLVKDNGGPLTVGRSLDEHAEQLAKTLKTGETDTAGRSFLESFVRPHGLHTAAAPYLVDNLETFVAQFEPAHAQRHPRISLLVLAVLRRVREIQRQWHRARKRTRKVLKRYARRWLFTQASRARRARVLAITTVRGTRAGRRS